jgi:hypothetical protein
MEKTFKSKHDNKCQHWQLWRVINKSDQLKHKYPDVSDDNIIYKCKCIQVDKINYNIK